MSNRITRKDLDALADQINDAIGASREVWTNGVANIGTHYVQGAYGGYQLQEVVTDGGGIKSVTYGYQPTRELYNQMRAYLHGIVAGRSLSLKRRIGKGKGVQNGN